MTDSQYDQRGDNLPIFIGRNNLYLSSKSTMLINGSSGTTSHLVINGHKNEDTDTGSGVVIENEATEKSRIRKAEKRVRVFPPLLSSLNRNGRPRFSLERLRNEGRLQISVVPNHFSEVVRTPQSGDRVSMELVEAGAH